MTCKECIAQRMKFFIKDFFSIYYKICKKLLIWSHLLKKSLMKNFIFCAVMLKKSAGIFEKLLKFVKSFIYKIVFYQLFGCLKTKSGPLRRRHPHSSHVNNCVFTKSNQESTRASYNDVKL